MIRYKILAHLLENSRKSFQEIAKSCLTSVPTVKSRVDRFIELGVIRKFTIDIDNSKLGIPEAMLLVNVKPHAVNRVAEELAGLEEVKELCVTSDSEAAIVSRVSGIFSAAIHACGHSRRNTGNCSNCSPKPLNKAVHIP